MTLCPNLGSWFVCLKQATRFKPRTNSGNSSWFVWREINPSSGVTTGQTCPVLPLEATACATLPAVSAASGEVMPALASVSGETSLVSGEILHTL